MFERYAIFYTPTGELADLGAALLGWDSARGAAVPHRDLGGIDVPKLTARARKYGLHATLKAPFHLSESAGQKALDEELVRFAASTAPCDIGFLKVVYRHGFIALRPVQHLPALQNVAAKIVTGFDSFRAPLTPEETARRRKSRMSPRQDQQLLAFGYPFIFDDFQFHLTLTGKLPRDVAEATVAELEHLFLPLLTTPFTLDAITLMGQDSGGMFHQIRRSRLTGQE